MRMVTRKAFVLILALWMGNNPSGWTCTCGFIYTVIWHSLLFHAKKYGTGWMDGWMDGWWSRVKDCFQQSKNIGCFFCFFRCGNLYIRLNRFLYLEHQKYLFGWVGEISVPGKGMLPHVQLSTSYGLCCPVIAKKLFSNSVVGLSCIVTFPLLSDFPAWMNLYAYVNPVIVIPKMLKMSLPLEYTLSAYTLEIFVLAILKKSFRPPTQPSTRLFFIFYCCKQSLTRLLHQSIHPSTLASSKVFCVTQNFWLKIFNS